jgi:hypothetical protein
MSDDALAMLQIQLQEAEKISYLRQLRALRRAELLERVVPAVPNSRWRETGEMGKDVLKAAGEVDLLSELTAVDDG